MCVNLFSLACAPGQYPAIRTRGQAPSYARVSKWAAKQRSNYKLVSCKLVSAAIGGLPMERVKQLEALPGSALGFALSNVCALLSRA